MELAPMQQIRKEEARVHNEPGAGLLPFDWKIYAAAPRQVHHATETFSDNGRTRKNRDNEHGDSPDDAWAQNSTLRLCHDVQSTHARWVPSTTHHLV